MSTPSHPHLRILLTNDDGIHAEGIRVLEAVARELTDDIWIAAPEREQSGASRKMSFTEPVLVHKLDDRRFAVAGTPADAAFLGVHDIVDGRPPDLVLSGINRGQNLAEDVTVSGTIAAAIQSSQLGITSFALSQTLKGILQGSVADYSSARAHGAALIRQLWENRPAEPVVMNINFPDCPPDAVKGVQVTRQGFRDQWHLTADKRTDLRGRTYYWLGWGGSKSSPAPGDDLHAIYHDYISVTPLSLDLTHKRMRDEMADTLKL